MPEVLDRYQKRALLGLIFSSPDEVDPALIDLMAREFGETREGADPDEQRRALLSALVSIARTWIDPRRVWRAIDAVEGTDLRGRGEAFLLVQTDGFGAEEELAVIAAALAPFAALVETATDAAASDRLLFARRRALPALEAMGRPLIEDVAVPRSRLAEAVRRIRAIADEEDVRIFVFGHAGDGNLHPIIVTEPEPAGAPIPAAAQRAADRQLERRRREEEENDRPPWERG